MHVNMESELPDLIIGNKSIQLPKGTYALEEFFKSGDTVWALYVPTELNISTLSEEEFMERMNGRTEEEEEDSC